MNMMIRTVVCLRYAALLWTFGGTILPLSAQIAETDHTKDRSKTSTVLYEGPMVHDQDWVMRYGTTNNNILGVFGGNCSTIPSNVRNLGGYEQIRFETEYQGNGVWNMARIDTINGKAVADTGQRYRYTYSVKHSFTGVTTDGKPPRPNRSRPTPTNPGFLDIVPSNVVAASLEFKDIFLLGDESSGRLLTDAQVLGHFHYRLDPAEVPPPFFPFVLDGYIATSLQTVAGQAGCDPL